MNIAIKTDLDIKKSSEESSKPQSSKNSIFCSIFIFYKIVDKIIFTRVSKKSLRSSFVKPENTLGWDHM